MAYINKRKLVYYINLIDSKLEGYTKKINMYCAGGTALTLGEKKTSSYDMDFVVSREDFRTLSGITAEIEYKGGVRIDLMPEGEHVDYFLPYDYKTYARKVGLFKNLNLYILSDLDIMLMKALAGRDKDYLHVECLKRKIKPEALLKRFEDLKFKKNKKGKLKGKLDKSIRRIYES